MVSKARIRPKPRELTQEEKLAKEKERIRKLQITIAEQDGLPYKASSDGSERLLDLLKKEHPERDPDKPK
jgi:hypothetical protein